MNIALAIVYTFLICGLNTVYSSAEKENLNGQPEGWINKKKELVALGVDPENTAPGELKTKETTYPRTLSQYLADLQCKKDNPLSWFRCHKNTSQCGCAHKSFSPNTIGKSCLYKDRLTECFGADYLDMEYNVEDKTLFGEKNIFQVHSSWRNDGKFLGGKATSAYSRDQLEKYLKSNVRSTKTQIGELLKTFGKNPAKDINSALYRFGYDSDGKGSLGSDYLPGSMEELEVERVQNCSYFNTFYQMHGIDLTEGKCLKSDKFCDVKDKYSPCNFVKTRYYRSEGETFDLDFEDFSLSNIFAVYLEKEDITCGSSVEDTLSGSDKIKFFKVPILKQINFPPRRLYKLGPFESISKKTVMKICACSNIGNGNEVYSCVKKENYNIEIGEVIIRDPIEVEYSDVELNKTVSRIDDENHLIFVECGPIASDCENLFERLKINWHHGTVEDLPGLSTHFIMGKRDGLNLTYKFDRPGRFCGCLINKEDAKVKTEETGYVVKGIKNVNATAYMEPGEETFVHPILLDAVEIKLDEIKAIDLVNSDESCENEIIGGWVGERYVISHIEHDGIVRALFTGFRSVSDDASYTGMLICAKYNDSENYQTIGHITTRKYLSYDYQELNELIHTDTSEPNSISSFLADGKETLFEKWRETIETSIKDSKRLFTEKNMDTALGPFLDKHFPKIIHLQVFREENTVLVWIAKKEDIIMFPVYKITVESPAKVKLAVIENRTHMYVLMDRKRLLVRYDVHELRDEYTLDDVSFANDIAMFSPMDFDILQVDGNIKIILVDATGSCLLLFDSYIRFVKKLCNSIGDSKLESPISISCVENVDKREVFECFIVEGSTDRIIWLSVNTSNDEFTHQATYITGTVVDDLDHNLGPIISLESFNFTDKSVKTIALVILRANGEHAAILTVDLQNKRIDFATELQNIPGYNRMTSINVALNGPTDHKLLIKRQKYISNPVKIGRDIEEILSSSTDKKNIKWDITWISLKDIVKVPIPHYEVPKYVFFKEQVNIVPKYRNKGRFKNGIIYRIDTDANIRDYVEKTFEINKYTGEISINAQTIKETKLSIRIISSIVGVERTTKLDFKFSCSEGEHLHEGICLKCPIGTYNSPAIVKEDDQYLTKCKPCSSMQTTKGMGSVSQDDCTCDRGYYMVFDFEGYGEMCVPCPPGSYKSVIGPEPCVGKCYENSVSVETGCINEEQRKCQCLPGYYWGGHYKETNDCFECEKGYFCEGGFKANKTKCPQNTTSITRATRLDQCVCLAGYEPLEGDYDISLIEVGNETKCIPCDKNKYKNEDSMAKCKNCPANTYSLSKANKTISDCNKCKPGYYETNTKGEPCRKCRENSYCPGSNPDDVRLKKISGKMEGCPENSISIRPYELNTSMLNCLCVEGYVPVITELTLKCIPAPKDHYKDTVGNVSAIPCPHGSITISTGSKSKDACVCDKGTYFDAQTQQCTTCPLGKFCLGGRYEEMNDRQPMDCPDVNALTKAPGASSVSECACKAGYYMDVDSHNMCKECPENHYKSYISNDLCTRCDENSSTSGKTGATSKEQCVCDPGYYFDRGCVSCDFNDKYCPGGVIEVAGEGGIVNVVTQSPVQCPPNTEIPPGVDNASSVSFCKCTKGYSFVSENLDNNEKVCAPCSTGTYKSSVMDSSCNGLCTQNATSLEGSVSSNQCFCMMGYFYLEGGICSKCMEGANCVGGLVNINRVNTTKNFVVDIDDHVKPVAVEGYYLDKINFKLRKPDDWKFIQCPINGSCLGNGRCSTSMEHYLCSECKKGYTNNFVKGALCQKCPNIIPNITLTVVYYFAILLVNIVMACLNISAGFNRRSIHSVVIKIALNYGICTSVINVINFNDLKLPVALKRITKHWIKMLDSEDVAYRTSIDCILRKWFNLEHHDSFFYAMLYMASLPVILLFIVTFLMWIILSLFKIKRYHDTRTKLALLHQSQIQGMHNIADGLMEQYENERLLMIFRYIPLPGQTAWVKLKNFLEDMIPIYVTVLFFVHGKTTSRMLSLLDCTYIDLGRSFPGKYVLRPAMSIKCSLDPSQGYLKYLILGLSGLIIWGFGIPFLSFMVLFVNRNNLYATSIRMKYGFLHNGFRQDYWYWETVVFTRKCLVLVIANIVIVPSQNYSGSRIWMALVVAVIFLIVQLIYKPFDERDYFVLGRLENHSMIVWTFTLILLSFIIEANFSPWYNSTLFYVIITINLLFVLEVIFYFLISFYSNIIFTIKSFFSSSKVPYFKASQLLFLNEPYVIYDQTKRKINIKPSSKLSIFSRSEDISNDQLNYFVTSLTYLYELAVNHFNLDVIPSLFVDFLIRYSISMANIRNKALEKRLFREYSRENLSKLLTQINEKEYENMNTAFAVDKIKEDYESDVFFKKVKDNLANIGFDEEELNLVMNSLFDDEFLKNDLCLSDLFQSIEKLYNVDRTELSLIFYLFKLFTIYFNKKETRELEFKIARLQEVKNNLDTRETGVDDRDEITRSIEKISSEINELRKIKGEHQDKLQELERTEKKYIKDQKLLIRTQDKPKEGSDNEEKSFEDEIRNFEFDEDEAAYTPKEEKNQDE